MLRRKIQPHWILNKSVAAFALAVLAACSTQGPAHLRSDPQRYAEAFREAEKNQVLDNIIRFRYNDPPSFIELTQIVSGYTIRSSASVGIDVLNIFKSPETTIGADGTVTFEDRPTLTYRPVRGREMVQEFLLPVDPANVLSVIQAGWPPDLVMSALVQGLNHVQNAIVFGTNRRPADPEFTRVVELFNALLGAGVIEFRVKQRTDDKGKVTNTTLMWLETPSELDKNRQLLDELRHLLRLSPNVKEFEVEFARVPKNENTLAIRTRSLFQAMAGYAGTLSLPQADIAAGRAWPPFGDASTAMPNLTVKFGPERPSDYFASMTRGATWFWIDDTDLESKRVLSFLVILVALTDFGQGPPNPSLTISTN